MKFLQPILLTLFISLTINLFAQQERKGYIGISIGPSFPIGNFGDTNINNDNAGLAENGTNLNLIDFGYKFSKHFGISAALGGAFYQIGPEVLNVQLNYVGFFIGPILSLSISERMDFNLIPRIGSTTASIDMDDTELAKEKDIGFDFGASLQYDLSTKWLLSVNSGYTSASYENDFNITAIYLNLGIAFRIR